jgi:hypothetical protein
MSEMCIPPRELARRALKTRNPGAGSPVGKRLGIQAIGDTEPDKPGFHLIEEAFEPFRRCSGQGLHSLH